MPARLDGKLAAGIFVSLLCGIGLWHAWPLYPFKLLVVLLHESGHAVATWLVGGSVDRIVLQPDEGGLTMSRAVPTVLNQIAISSAGYLGSTVAGCVLLVTAARARAARIPLLVLAGWVLGLAVLFERDAFSLGFSIGTALLLGLIARFAPDAARRFLLVFLATFCCAYALFDIEDDLLHLGSVSGRTDADMLSQVTHLPPLFWGLAWALLSLVLVFVTLRAVVVRRPRTGGQPARPGGMFAA